MQNDADITIVGGGVLGLATAIALAKAGFTILIMEASQHQPTWSREQYDHRVSAITLASKHYLNQLNVWDAIHNRRSSAFKSILVWERGQSAELQFDAASLHEQELGFIIENNLLLDSLLQTVAKLPQIKILQPIQLTGLTPTASEVLLYTSDNTVFHTSLVIGCDGRQSWVRQHVPINYHEKDYQQKAIVATIHTELPHKQIAYQVFLPDGVLAFLPLKDPHLTSIVWSVDNALAEQLLQLDKDEFVTTLQAKVDNRFGKLSLSSTPRAFSLYDLRTNSYIAERIALVGDAAHTVHPLAGQGINIGLADAASLTEVLTAARQKGKDIGQKKVLRQYDRWRKGDNFLLLSAIPAIKNFFANITPPLPRLRNAGFRFINQCQPLQVFITQHATGKRHGLTIDSKSS